MGRGCGSEEMAQPQIQTGQLASTWYFEPRLSLLFQVLPTAKLGLCDLPQLARPLITRVDEAWSHLCLEHPSLHTLAPSLVPREATSEGPAPTTCPEALLPMAVPRIHPLPCLLPPSLYIMSLYASYLTHTHTLTELPSSPPGQGSLTSHSGSSGLEPITEGPNTCFCKAMTGSSIYHPGKRISFLKKTFYVSHHLCI